MHRCARRLVPTLFLSGLLLSLPALAVAQCEDLAQEWFGLYDITFGLQDCETGAVFISETGQDKLCADDCFDRGTDPDNPEDCTETREGNTLTIDCASEEEVLPGCIQTTVESITYTLGEGSINGVGQLSITFEGGTCLDEIFEDQCFDVAFAAERVAGPAVCQVTNLPGSWSLLKGSFK